MHDDIYRRISVRDWLDIARRADAFLRRSSDLAAWRNPIIAKYVAAARAESTWCRTEVICQAAKMFRVSERTVESAIGSRRVARVPPPPPRASVPMSALLSPLLSART
jgi:hypothetical protein